MAGRADDGRLCRLNAFLTAKKSKEVNTMAPMYHETAGGKPVMYGLLPAALKAVPEIAKNLKEIEDSLEKIVQILEQNAKEGGDTDA